jgi:hypothetical protein
MENQAARIIKIQLSLISLLAIVVLSGCGGSSSPPPAVQSSSVGKLAFSDIRNSWWRRVHVDGERYRTSFRVQPCSGMETVAPPPTSPQHNSRPQLRVPTSGLAELRT